MQSGLAGIKKRGTKNANGGIFGSIDGDFAVKFFTAADAVALRCGVIYRENLGTKSFRKFLNHFEGNVLATFFDAVDSGLASAYSTG